MQQLGGNLIKNESLQLSSPRYRHIWECIYEPAVKGGYAIYDGYSSDLSKTGEIICSTGSTAGILFYGSEIIYPDNTTEQVKYTVLPFPLFKGGEKVAIQRGSGMIVASSTPEKEKAAAVFLKWFTAPEQNLKFVSSTGYLPVTHQAFNNIAEHENSLHKNENIKKLLEAAIKVHQEYDFFIPPVFDAYNSLSKKYEQEMKALAKSSREEYLALLEILPPNEAYERATEGDFEAFVSVVQ
jgi:multiple sugar transport system substrate-binding protein